MDSQNYFEVSLQFFRYCGIALVYPKGFKGIFMKLFYFASVFSLTFWIVAEISYLIDNVDDFEESANTIVISFTSFLALVQLFTFYRMTKEVVELIEQLTELTKLGSRYFEF